MQQANLQTLLSQRWGGRWHVQARHASGFCQTWRAEASAQAPRFLKTLAAERIEVLRAEADGLQALADTRTVAVPAVLDCFEAQGVAVLALPWLDLQALTNPADATRFGAALAALHSTAPAGDGRFGWRRKNWLGGTAQCNDWSAATGLPGWLQFLSEHRLLAMSYGLDTQLQQVVQQVVAVLPSLFAADDHAPQASLVHGDLWSGNWAGLPDGTPVIFDPAVSVSDAESELAMMELFGAPPAGFWSAYCATRPLARGYPLRRPVYQLVHVLNHVRLFGVGYRQQALALADSVLRCRP